MAVVLWAVALCAAYVGCRWSGRMLDGHYNDRYEIAAVLVVAICVFVPLVINSVTPLVDDVLLKASICVVACVGLFTGRGRLAR